MKTSVDTIPPCTNCTNNNSVFCCLTHEDKQSMTSMKGNNFFKKGQVIFYEGNHPHGVYCVYNGKIKIAKVGDEGKEQIVRFASNGDLLGYRSVLSDESYKATATAIEDSYVCHLQKDRFFEVLKRDNTFSLAIIKRLTNDLKKSEIGLINISQKPVRERIAETVLILKDQFGFTDDCETLNVVLSRREISDLAGVTPETVIRTLSSFNKEGIIKLEGKRIVITNPNLLLRTANLSG